MRPVIAAWFFLAALVVLLPSRAMAAERSPQELFNEAVQLFFDAKPVESARLFDELVEAVPGAEPDLWQRGLALYYADRFADGRAQFELHRTVNPNDVENPAWHFLCVARLEGVKAAREKLLPVGEDSRVPMKEILSRAKGKPEGTSSATLICILGSSTRLLGTLKKPGSTSPRQPGPIAWTTPWAKSPSCTPSSGGGSKRPARLRPSEAGHYSCS